MHPARRRTTTLRTLRTLLAAGALVLVGLVTAPPAQAHNSVASTEPAASSTLAEAPAAVVLHFEEAPLPGGTTIVVRGPKGAPVTDGKTTIKGADASVPLAALTDSGIYTVSYRSASDDGHTITGTFTFTLTLAPAATETPTPTPTPTTESATPTPSTESTTPAAPASSAASSTSDGGSTGSGSGALPWVIGGLAVVAVVGGGAVLLSRRRTP